MEFNRYVTAAREVTGSGAMSLEERGISPQLVRRALADLPAHQRALLTLVCVDGMSYRTAAELLDIAIGAVAAELARAREALNERIELRRRPDGRGSTNSFGSARADPEEGEHS